MKNTDKATTNQIELELVEVASMRIYLWKKSTFTVDINKRKKNGVINGNRS